MVLVGGPEDAALGAGIADAAPGAVNLAGEMSVLASAALIARAACVASGDTGVMHLATAVGTPVVASSARRRATYSSLSPAPILERAALPTLRHTAAGPVRSGITAACSDRRAEVEAAVRDVVGSMITDE